MKDIAHAPARRADDGSAVDDPDGRVAAYVARTQTALDLLALGTLWIVVPFGDFGTADHASTVARVLRVAISLVYALDITIRAVLARRHAHYLVTHPLGIAAAIFPPMRVIFSIRLIRSMFRRGHLSRFLVAAAVLVINGAIIVYLFERHAPHSNIHTLGESFWWSAVTVTTVGYGDFYPVTTAGRVTACFIMGTGLLTLAVVTAQVAASFTEQAQGRAGRGRQAGLAASEVTLAELDQRLARIEELITVGTSSSQRATETAESGGDRP